MVQWVTVVLALLGFAYNGYKDYSNGNLKVLTTSDNSVKTNYPIQYCVMAYDPNLDKVFYQHENGQWHDYPPQQRRYASSTQPQRNQNQESYALGDASGASGASGYRVR